MCGRFAFYSLHEALGLQARPVSRHVNDARNQGAGLLELLGTVDDAP